MHGLPCDQMPDGSQVTSRLQGVPRPLLVLTYKRIPVSKITTREKKVVFKKGLAAPLSIRKG